MTSPLPAPASRGAQWAVAARIYIPALWLGLIIGISFIEAPLKFTAPGITIPLGLGIGRRVFFAMNMVEIIFFIALVAGSAKRAAGKAWGWGVGLVGLLLLIKPQRSARASLRVPMRCLQESPMADRYGITPILAWNSA